MRMGALRVSLQTVINDSKQRTGSLKSIPPSYCHCLSTAHTDKKQMDICFYYSGMSIVAEKISIALKVNYKQIYCAYVKGD